MADGLEPSGSSRHQRQPAGNNTSQFSPSYSKRTVSMERSRGSRRTRSCGRVDGDVWSKYAIDAWVNWSCRDLITCGIRINCINPGPTQTPMMAAFHARAGKEIVDRSVGPIGRYANLRKQGWPLVLLCSLRHELRHRRGALDGRRLRRGRRGRTADADGPDHSTSLLTQTGRRTHGARRLRRTLPREMRGTRLLPPRRREPQAAERSRRLPARQWRRTSGANEPSLSRSTRGAIVLTVMPWRPSSLAIDLVKPITPAFAAE